MRFVIGTNLVSEPAWWLVDDDDRTLAWAGRTFESLAFADQAAHDFRVSAEDPRYRFHVKASGVWRWTAWGPGESRVAISGEWYHTERAARVAADAVRRQAATAIGP